MAKAKNGKTERVPVWLTPEQLAWLKTKENVSVTLRALVTEAMNMERLAESVKGKKTKAVGGPVKKGKGGGKKEKD